MKCSDPPPSFSCFPSGSSSSSHQLTEWTPYENKIFENALAEFDLDTPDRFEKIALMVPGKTVEQIKQQYELLVEDIENIDSGLFPIPDYVTSEEFDEDSECRTSKRSSGMKSGDLERKKGVPWSEEEHRLFLMGLNKYGKGDWRSISRNYVLTRTPTQVASHAQKYFIRLSNSGSTRDRRRTSIHDIRSVNPPTKPMMSGNTKFKPIAPSPFPSAPPILPPRMNYFPFLGSSRVRNRYSSSSISMPGSLTSIPHNFTPPASYVHNGAYANYLSDGSSSSYPSNNLMSSQHFDTYNPAYPLHSANNPPQI